MANIPASSDNVQTADLCVSDVNKTLLLHNPDFIPYLVDGLLLDPDHPRAGLPDHAKAWLQTMLPPPSCCPLLLFKVCPSSLPLATVS